MDAAGAGVLPGVQARALALEGLGVGIGWDIVGPFDPLKGKAAINVPDNVAMHQPGTWVVGLEANDGVAGRSTWTGRSGQHGSVTTHRVVEVQGRGQSRSPADGTLA